MASGTSQNVLQLPSAPVERILSGEWQARSFTQPIVDLTHGVITGYEALARFPAEAGLRPDQALQAAEKIGRRNELEAQLASAAFQLRSQLPENCFLSVNLSPTFILSEEWRRLLADTGGLHRIVIEITEDHVIDDYAAMRRHLERMRMLGGTIAIDDTGAGYASLKHVMELRPDFIKLDRLFVDGCHLDPTKRQMIELLGETADRLDAWVIAEGIENEAELRELMRLGIPLGQGYFLGRPAPDLQAISQDCLSILRAQKRHLPTGLTVGNFAEFCKAAPSIGEAYDMLISDPLLQSVIVIDSWSRPIELVERHPLLGIRTITSLLRAQVGSSPSEVLPRALNRTSAERFNPVVVVDELGWFQGLLPVERLMEAALEQVSSSKLTSMAATAAAA